MEKFDPNLNENPPNLNNEHSTDRQEDPVPKEEGQAQVGEPRSEGAQDDLDHPGGVRGVLDAVPRDRHHRQGSNSIEKILTSVLVRKMA